MVGYHFAVVASTKTTNLSIIRHNQPVVYTWCIGPVLYNTCWPCPVQYTWCIGPVLYITPDVLAVCTVHVGDVQYSTPALPSTVYCTIQYTTNALLPVVGNVILNCSVVRNVRGQ